MSSISTISKKVFYVSSFENLLVSIFVVGYKNIGESIVVLLRDNAKSEETAVIMSMVIDSYKTSKLNLTRTILEKFEVKTLDFVCWTHPHCDHSPGIDDLIKDYFHDNLVIFSPEFHYANLSPDLLKSESARTMEIFNGIWDQVKDNANFQEIWRTVLANGDATHTYPMKIHSISENTDKSISFFFLTPLGSRTAKYAVVGNEFSSPNELSVSFIMSLDGYDFYFGGDTENEHADGIDTRIIQGMRWIKVPHHCSFGAQSISDRVGPNLDFAASTVFTSSDLPEEVIQDKYAQKCLALHMTQLREEGEYTLDHDYGIIQYDYVFKGNEALIDIRTYGNAGQYFSKKQTLIDSSTVGSIEETF